MAGEEAERQMFTAPTRPRHLVVPAVVLVVLPLLLWARPASPRTEQTPRQRYIVLLHDDVDAVDAVASRHARLDLALVRNVFEYSNSYLADLTPEDAAELRDDPDVRLVEPRRVLTISDLDGVEAPAGAIALDAAAQVAQGDQVVPLGIQRAFASANPNLNIDGVDGRRVDVDVAVIDTGVALHPDLDVVTRLDCSSGTCQSDSGTDDNGHGTHVAGTIGAIDNSIGVVGVAPGARIHSLKVCNALGECPGSAVLAAVDWITEHGDVIEVVNMSLGGGGVNVPLAEAISRSVDAGVVYVAAAGNNASDANNYSPASSPDVVAVSALSDSDGKPGALGGAPTCRARNTDDTLADFSNFGTAIDIAAPGMCILSTAPDGGTKVLSGTSMASPHVAGAAAVLTAGSRSPTDRSGVALIRQELIATGNTAWTDTSGDGINEPLLDIRDPTRYPPSTATKVTTLVSDDFETTAGGWTSNASGVDSATGGRWQQSDPEPTSSAGVPVQLGTTTSGLFALVTGALAGPDVAAGDVDRGRTSIRSADIVLPAAGTLTLTARWYFSHLADATTDDFFRITVVSSIKKQKVFEQLGATQIRPATWSTLNADLAGFAGKTIRIVVEVGDASTASTIEAAIDDLRITQETRIPGTRTQPSTTTTTTKPATTTTTRPATTTTTTKPARTTTTIR